MIALIVSLKVHPERLEDFLDAIKENATRTFSDEAGCKYFDVTQDIKDPLHFMFYELYEDDAAIDAHRAAPHFAKWREAADRCVVKGSQVNTLCTQLFHHA
ncbi:MULTISPECIES: putative quinol monooxygenase [unclassified Burkholderia]|uniref:putative quinol monooxygenase n=1 Tax=unclassified Burkholderia TaxID=2613784 RepID=UPI000F564BFC|nr:MULTISPECIES: putative quinol monooxygenase [unclassified Burkholderia]RQR30757.1 antibiotic biosynthesis monooxygenase [Burkholderia sp. Bp9142]RQR45977.1 antibiotic biosynthesis monooxygenase [Burkholderia sp. Bp9140]